MKQSKKLSLEELKALPAFVSSSGLSKLERYSFSLLPGGLPKSGLVELGGPPGCGKTEAVLCFLKENPLLQIAWIEKNFTIFPSAFTQHQIALSRILFLDLDCTQAQQNLLGSLSYLIKSRLFQVIILSQLDLIETDLRRFQLFSKSTGTLILLLKNQVSKFPTWAFSLQAEVKRQGPSGNPTLYPLKNRKFR